MTQSVNKRAVPAFYQFVTKTIFKELIKREHPLSASTSEKACAAFESLTHMEENALRYVSGYVVHHVRKNLDKLSHAKKDDMIYFLVELAGDESDEEAATEDWTNMIDRGGLWHVNDLTYRFFLSMEQVVRCYFKACPKQQEGMNKLILDNVIKSDDVAFYWCLIGPDFDDELKEIIERKIVELYQGRIESL